MPFGVHTRKIYSQGVRGLPLKNLVFLWVYVCEYEAVGIPGAHALLHFFDVLDTLDKGGWFVEKLNARFALVQKIYVDLDLLKNFFVGKAARRYVVDNHRVFFLYVFSFQDFSVFVLVGS